MALPQAPLPGGPGEGQPGDREEARRRLTTRRDFFSHLVAYVVVNGFLVGVWALTGAGYFWPAWVLAAWGVGLVLHAWDVFVRRPVTEADVEEEMRRRKH
ncbi:MAG TPA: 2TM domain-containing protein [Acidimicrobiales bacterium]|nr:2TM domain-containing protein [Acidimicrobiales bacterium]